MMSCTIIKFLQPSQLVESSSDNRYVKTPQNYGISSPVNFIKKWHNELRVSLGTRIFRFMVMNWSS